MPCAGSQPTVSVGMGCAAVPPGACAGTQPCRQSALVSRRPPPAWRLLFSLPAIHPWLPACTQGAAQEVYQRFQVQQESVATIATQGALLTVAGWQQVLVAADAPHALPAASAAALCYTLVVVLTHKVCLCCATGRAKPINPMSVVGYLADCGGTGALSPAQRVCAG